MSQLLRELEEGDRCGEKLKPEDRNGNKKRGSSQKYIKHGFHWYFKREMWAVIAANANQLALCEHVC